MKITLSAKRSKSACMSYVYNKMPIYFITGNSNKFSEAKKFIPEIEQLNVDLDELQSLDTKKVLDHKVQEGFKHLPGNFFVEDTSLHMDALKGLPGPLVKWFLEPMGIEGLAEIAEKMGNRANVKTIFAFAKAPNQIEYFEGSARGIIVQPRGSAGWEWDKIFQPDGSDKTLSEIKEITNDANAFRKEGLLKLKNYLTEHALS